MTNFTVPDQLIKALAGNNITYIQDLWNPQTIELFPEIFYCKLIPLNKNHPMLATIFQMRPIVATNVIFKILETRFSTELQEAFWKLPGYAKSQFGFLRHMSTQAQIFNLLDQATEGWAKPSNARLHKHIVSSHPQMPKYDPPRNFLIFIDLKQAYNSVNMQLLYNRMRQDRILEDDKLTFLFALYGRLKIYLGEEHYSPINGVPQGGVNSPILFNFAMQYFLSDAAERINKRLQHWDQLPLPPKAMTPEKNFKWADDLATLLQVNPKKAKLWIKTYFTILIEEGSKWGLNINFNKSAIMELFTQRTNYNFLSDEKTAWTKNKGTTITLTIYPNAEKTVIKIPVTPVYKYLGVKINRNLMGREHLESLKAKTNYITNAFTATRIASQDLKFCINTWQLFVRPLLDYSQTYFSFVSEKDRSLLHTRYRTSLKKMLFMPDYVPDRILDMLIQYDYRTLHQRFRQIASQKTTARLEGDIKDPILKNKVKFHYNRINTDNIPLLWAEIWSKISAIGKPCKASHHSHPANYKTNREHIIKTLEEFCNFNVTYELLRFINPITYISCDISNLHKIHNLLLRIV